MSAFSVRAKGFAALAMLSSAFATIFLTKHLFGVDAVLIGCVLGTLLGFLAAALTCRQLTDQLIIPDR